MPDVSRFLITTINPEVNGYTGVCLVCFETETAPLDAWTKLTDWAREHHCHPDRVAAARTLIGDRIARCLYCGSTDITEVRVTVDERTSDMALQCDACSGVWAP
ncbi:hypothetical protein GCM10009678_90330 [Actinomadura kijaniata]|uniref:Uncharacterized protein n=1 Tax=Actinomadura namibiensis TaxID=182080 RepID=A0A7W3LPK3_ACTNM|nr:hypothetical protein [Actinomadura namibiensis]MBA8951892.1 hypothetical protein [Actinomadura namibiensis]